MHLAGFQWGYPCPRCVRPLCGPPAVLRRPCGPVSGPRTAPPRPPGPVARTGPSGRVCQRGGHPRGRPAADHASGPVRQMPSGAPGHRRDAGLPLPLPLPSLSRLPTSISRFAFSPSLTPGEGENCAGGEGGGMASSPLSRPPPHRGSQVRTLCGIVQFNHLRKTTKPNGARPESPFSIPDPPPP